MFAALVILNIFHPGRVLCGPDSEFPRLSRAEKKRLRQEKKELKVARKDGLKRWGFWRRKSTRVRSGEDVQGGSFDSLGEREAAREGSEENHAINGYGLAGSTYEPVSSR